MLGEQSGLLRKMKQKEGSTVIAEIKERS